MFKLKAKDGYVIIEPSEDNFSNSPLAETKSEEHTNIGKIIDIGGAATFENFDGIEFEPDHYEIGEIVVYVKYGEQEITLNNKQYHIVRFDKIIASVEKN